MLVGIKHIQPENGNLKYSIILRFIWSKILSYYIKQRILVEAATAAASL